MEAQDRRVKELKVNIPTELHLQLLRLKILHGQTIASTVEEALRIYFDRLPPQMGALPEPYTSVEGGDHAPAPRELGGDPSRAPQARHASAGDPGDR